MLFGGRLAGVVTGLGLCGMFSQPIIAWSVFSPPTSAFLNLTHSDHDFHSFLPIAYRTGLYVGNMDQFLGEDTGLLNPVVSGSTLFQIKTKAQSDSNRRHH